MTVDVGDTAPTRVGDVGSHFATFRQLVVRAQDLLDMGRFEEAAVCGEAAAGYAWHNHPGVFASRWLEDILLAVGREAFRGVPSPGPRRPAQPAGPERVLHVLTQAYPIGGHTRLVWRWIQQDAARVHSVVLTGQRDHEVPPRLGEAVEGSRGELRLLDADVGKLLLQARALRKLAISSDRVVLHVHPHDVVPLMALAPADGLPPVIFLNHADHVFWLGVSISDVVASLRESGLRLARDRRGIEDGRCVLLPIPLAPAERRLSRREAKRRLGFPDDVVMILSVASAYKYVPIDGVGFVDAILPVLERHEQAVLVVVGPGPDGPWRSAEAQARGRLLAMGVRDDVSPFYEAADIYVDSFPFSSLTSLLEAGGYGIPLVTYCSHVDTAAVLCADDPGLSGSLIRVTGLGELREALSRLIEDAKLRARMGESVRDEILQVHAADSWRDALETVYLRADGGGQTHGAPRECGQRRPDALDRELVRLRVHVGVPRDLKAWVLAQITEVLTLRDAQLALRWGRVTAMLRILPGLWRVPTVQSSVVSMVRRLALASDAPLGTAKQMCAEFSGAAREGGVERVRIRRLLAEIWAELAVALGRAPRRDDRAAAYAAVRALLHGRSHVGRRTLLGLAARGIVGWQTTARQTISGGRGSAGRGAE